MKFIIAGCILLMHALQAGAAGFQSLEIPGPGGKPLALAIWYPSPGAVRPHAMGAFSQDVAPDGPVGGAALPPVLPLVLISHGSGGDKFSHHDTALALAEAGHVVLALTHPGDNHADRSAATDVLARPRHVRAALDYMLAAWPQRAHIDPARIGIFGFSSGGFTALVSAGGQPDLGKLEAHCTAHPADYACVLTARIGKPAPLPAGPELHDRRIRAAVVAAPALGFTFNAAALRQVGMPIQLWRAEHDALLPHPWYAEQVATSLPREPEYHVVPGAGHFDFLAPCSARLAEIAPPICASRPDFDRRSFHQRFNAEVTRFFTQALPPAPSSAR